MQAPMADLPQTRYRNLLKLSVCHLAIATNSINGHLRWKMRTTSLLSAVRVLPVWAGSSKLVVQTPETRVWSINE